MTDSEDDIKSLPKPEIGIAGWKPDPSGAGELRYWNGIHWTTRTGTQQAVAMVPMTPDESKQDLEAQIREWFKRGYRVDSQSDFQAIMVKGKRVNHLLHLILTIITLGLWAIVWIILAIGGGESRVVLTARTERPADPTV